MKISKNFFLLTYLALILTLPLKTLGASKEAVLSYSPDWIYKFTFKLQINVDENGNVSARITNVKPAMSEAYIWMKFNKEIEDVLDIEVMQKKVAGYYQVGAVMQANNLGCVIHPETDEEDMKKFSEILGVNIEHSTINGGTP